MSMEELRRSGRLCNGNSAPAVDVESEEESEEEEWQPRRTSRRMTNAAPAEEDAVVRRLASVTLNEVNQVKNPPQVVVNSVRSRYVQGKSKPEEMKDSDIAVPQELVIGAMDSGSSDDGDSTDVEEEQEVVDRSLTNEGAILLAEVERVLGEGGDISKLRVDHLKSYLRHHGLRMAGVKVVLLNRIKDHLRLKDGQGEWLYPRSSFRINCRGDVCFGDIVLFRHTVYDNDNFKRHGRPLGDRWVAGRIVNESYGAQKQQHTFTIEVFWSTGTRPFYILQPIRIKGRNLYRMTTLRQPWNNEEDRRKALDEKHARGEEARFQRQRRIETGSSSKGPSKPRPRPSNQEGAVRAPHHTNSTLQPRKQARMESDRNGRDHLTRPVTMAGESDRNVPPVMRHEGFVPRGCSTQGCERAGAVQCIVRSCGPCCYKFTLPRGSCPRHQ